MNDLLDGDLMIPVLLAETSLFHVLTVSFVVIGLSVCLHALVMEQLYNRLCKPSRHGWTRLTAIVLILLLTHTVQIMMFGLAYHTMVDATHGFEGVYDGSFNDAVYFSAAVYTTVGFGDITPLGYLRLMVSFEALAGLVLIAWSASFTFVAMSKLAKPDDREPDEMVDHTLAAHDTDEPPA
ncbi:MAG: potassium channel family protein [Planctomycetota bacterium]